MKTVASEVRTSEMMKFKTNVKNAPRIQRKRGGWTPDEASQLVRLTNKYPAGVADRWQQIADAMQRTVDDVCAMSG